MRAGLLCGAAFAALSSDSAQASVVIDDGYPYLLAIPRQWGRRNRRRFS